MNKIAKTIIAVLCFVNLQAYAQIDAPIYKFYGSVTKNLKIGFKPVAVMIKVDVDDAGKVGSIDVSDSAGPDFKSQFEAAKTKFDLDGLNQYITLNKLKSKSFMIPYNVKDENAKTLSSQPLLTKFNGKDFKRTAKILSPINASYSVTTTTTTTTVTPQATTTTTTKSL